VGAAPSFTNVTIPSQRGGLGGYLAHPEGDGPWPGVVVIFDAGGLTGDTVRQCDWLASEGFRAVAPDLYRGRRIARCLVSVMRDAIRGEGEVFDDIADTRDWLEASPHSNGRIGVLGFCMGGGFALLLAPGHGFAASAPNYGGLPKNPAATLAGACPIVASYGGRDRTQRHAAQRLDEVLDDLGVVHDVKEYPDAGHGFMNDHEGAGDRIPLVFSVMGRWARNGFHEPSARDARRRIVAFFGQHLEA
jgi:carboxymethylenebutenolidase